MNLKKLLSKGHLVPIYEAREDTIFLVGYRRKASSRKRSQRPFMLKSGVPVGKIPTNPASEEEPIAQENPESSENNPNP